MKIICYGDSNTYGYDPRSFIGDKYDKSWPEIIAEKTGNKVRSMGMPGRQIPFRARPLEAMHAQIGEHVDILMIMLGSNDIEASLNVHLVEARMSTMIKEVLRWDIADRIILIGPPPLKVTSRHLEASKEMNEAFGKLAGKQGIEYVDSFDWPLELCFDRTHLTEDDQEIFADEIIKRVLK
ncbi:MAG: SGNH/GDSL hydrolase family protein [Bacillota bacterium]|nr:SGNH/GDSL hydrolase family protein [Bacillota bacterium]